MKADVDGILALAATSGYATYFVDVPTEPTYPYILIWSSGGGLSPERPIADTHADVDDLIGVTTVAGTPAGVLIAQAVVRGVLDLKSPVVSGRTTILELVTSQPVQLDRDVRNPTTNKNPAYGVDLYRYRAV
jgi:hypothetical protein